MSRYLLSLLIAVSLVGCAGEQIPGADLILTGGQVVTMDDAIGTAEAIAVSDGKVLAVGDVATIDAFRGDATKVIELDGRMVVPGFTDGHAHFRGIGRSLMNIDLRAEPTWEAIVERIAAAASERPEGEWILGWGWHQDKWETPPAETVEGYPVHDLLSAAVPNHPVLLKHHAGTHGGLANAKALELAGIDATTQAPPGGTILRKADGSPTGVLRETAYKLALKAQTSAMEALGDEGQLDLKRREAVLANEACLEQGVTSVQDAGSDFDDIELFRAMYADGELDVRLWLMLTESNEALAERMAEVRTIGDADGFLTVRAIKRYADGALGTHGAWMLEPYEDLNSVGLPTTPIEELKETARLAREHGYQLCVHAIGDRANREVLDIFEEAAAGDTNLRWRVEHAQHLDPDDIPRFAELGVIASMQGVHCTSDAPFVPKRLGDDRSEAGAYVWRSLLESGATIVNGTDAPIENVSPLENFYSTVTRRTKEGEIFYGDQRMTRMEALRAATSAAAYAGFEEETKGTLAPGMLADLVVLSQDILEVPEEDLLQTTVDMTIVDGQVRFTK